jgi:uncharacterized protein (TIGR02246 family)
MQIVPDDATTFGYTQRTLNRRKGTTKRFATLCATTVIALMMTACNETADTHDADVKALKDIEAQWNRDFASKDPDKLVAHYADDAVLMSPGMPASSGKAAIRNTLKQMVSDPAFSLKFQASKVEIARSGDVAYTQGSYTMAMTDAQTKQVVSDHGNYVTTYRKPPDGAWKAVADIATSEVPPPASPPEPPKKHQRRKTHHR